MLKLWAIFYVIVSPVVAGALIVAVLTNSAYTNNQIIWAAVAGFVLALPVSWFVAKKINALTSKA
jgi:hypothetical protein